jgi:ATPase subunit of ABC transporter with duplicated ATPase domains
VTAPSIPVRPTISAFESGIASHDVSTRITLRQQAIDTRRGEVAGLMGLSGIANILLVAAIQEELDELLQTQSRDRTLKYNQDAEEDSKRKAAAAAAAAAESQARAAAELKASEEAEEAAAKEIEAALQTTPARPTAAPPQVDPSTPEYAQWYYTQYLPYLSQLHPSTPGRSASHRLQ